VPVSLRVQQWPVKYATCVLLKSSTVLNLWWQELVANNGTAFVWRRWLQIWLIANGGAICDRSIVEQLCDWCGLQQAMGRCCHSHYIRPRRSLRVKSSLKHQDKSDFCKLFRIQYRFANNCTTDGINIMVPKQLSVLWVPYWPQTFIWDDSIYIFYGR